MTIIDDDLFSDIVDAEMNSNVDQSLAKSQQEIDLNGAIEKGGRCESKYLYHVPVKKQPGNFEWDERKPADSEIADRWEAKKERDIYAVVEFQKFVDDEWVTSHLQINSVRIQKVLEEVLEGYPGLTQYELSSFAPPYLPFFHR